jgi:hypothetical protein
VTRHDTGRHNDAVVVRTLAFMVVRQILALVGPVTVAGRQ